MSSELIERLRAICRGRQGTYAIRRDAGLAADALEAAASRERELAAKDARLLEAERRLRFLCSRMFQVEVAPEGDQHKWIFRNIPLYGPNVPAAIDAAMAGEEP